MSYQLSRPIVQKEEKAERLRETNEMSKLKNLALDNRRLYRRFNSVESDIVTKTNKWGGSDIIGGSPRDTGSKLNPEKLQKIACQTMSKVRR